MPSFVSAQIIIKEKVEVNPQSVIIPDNPIQGHTVRVDIEWIPSNVEGSIIFYDLYCTTPNSAWSGTSSTGSLSFSHTKNGYEYYHIQFRFYPCTLFPYPQPHNIQGTYTIYYDGRFMKTAPFQIEGVCGSGGGNAIYNTAFRPPLVTDYQFKITTENFCYGSSGNIFVLGTANNCSNSFEIDTSVNKTLKLEILDGKEYVSFYQNGEKKDTATIRYDNLDYWGYYIKDISIMADSIYTGSQPQNVIIKSNWADEIRLDTITILHQIPTQIYVSDDQPIIVRYGTSGIQVKTNSSYGSDSCWAEMPDSVKYKAVIIKGQNLGNLFDYNTGNAGDMLINLSHNNGQIVIGFVTEGENLTEVDTVIVSISTTDPNINTVQAMLLIQPNDINVTIIPSTISQGDTARVVLMKNGQNGLEPFPPNKLFNVEVVNGTDYGLILDSLSNDTLTTFSNIPQGFKIIARDSTGIDSTKIRIKVTTEEEITLPAVRLTKEKQIEEIQNKSQTKQDKEGELIEAFIGDLGAPILIEGFGDVVVKEDECDEEIVVCNNYQPPKFEDVGTITVLKSDTAWQWIDNQGKAHTTSTGNACNFNPLPGEFGKTYIMPKIGDFSPGNSIYNLLDDTKVTVCQDKNDPTDPIWRYSVENLRIPIFRDHCPAWAIANDYVDLLDGTNVDTLAKYINNCTDYIKVMATLNWWWNGPYFQAGQSSPYKFYFSAGIIAHENAHVRQMTDGGTKVFPVGSIYSEMNNGIKGFRALVKYKYSAIVAKCPEDALIAVQGTGTMEERIKIQLDAALTLANDLVSLGGQDNQGRDNSDLEADELARPKYDEIKTNIENWAKQQSWWCIPWPIVGDDYYRGCDQSKCTP